MKTPISRFHLKTDQATEGEAIGTHARSTPPLSGGSEFPSFSAPCYRRSKLSSVVPRRPEGAIAREQGRVDVCEEIGTRPRQIVGDLKERCLTSRPSSSRSTVSGSLIRNVSRKRPFVQSKTAIC